MTVTGYGVTDAAATQIYAVVADHVVDPYGSAEIAISATTPIVVPGTFVASGTYTVALSGTATTTNSVTATAVATAGELTLTLTNALEAGVLSVTVTGYGVTDATATQILTVFPDQTILASTPLAVLGTELTIFGTDFFLSPDFDVTVTFIDANGGAPVTANVVSVSATEVVVDTLGHGVNDVGSFDVSITQRLVTVVATGINQVVEVATITPGSSLLIASDPTFTISGTGFSTTASDHVLTFTGAGDTMTGTVSASTDTTLTVSVDIPASVAGDLSVTLSLGGVDIGPVVIRSLIVVIFQVKNSAKSITIPKLSLPSSQLGTVTDVFSGRQAEFTFYLENNTPSGVDTVTITDMNVSGGFAVQTSHIGEIQVGKSIPITIVFLGSTVEGASNGVVTISTDRLGDYAFNIRADVTLAGRIAAVPSRSFKDLSVALGGSDAVSYVLTNQGEAPISVGLATTLGPIVTIADDDGQSSAAFSVSTQPASPLVLGIGQSTTVDIVFKPVTAVGYSATFSFNSDGPEGVVVVDLNARGIEVPSASYAVGSKSGSSIVVDEPFQALSHADTITIGSNGDLPLVVSSMEVSADSAGFFTIAASSDTVTIAPGSTFDIAFSMDLLDGEPRTGSVIVTTNSISNPTTTISITATGSSLPDIAIASGTQRPTATTPLEMGRTLANTPISKVVSIFHSGNGESSVAISSVSIIAGESNELTISQNVGAEALVTLDEFVTFTLTYSSTLVAAPQEWMIAVDTDIGGGKTYQFAVTAVSSGLAWADVESDVVSVAEGKSTTFDVLLPFAMQLSNSMFSVSGTADPADYVLSFAATTNPSLASITVRIVNDNDEEALETLSIALVPAVANTPSLSIAIPANDVKTSSTPISTERVETTVVQVSGKTPVLDSNGAARRSSVEVRVPSTAVSKSTTVLVEVVEEESDKYVSPMVSMTRNNVRFQSAGPSFAIELSDDAVLTGLIEVSVPIEEDDVESIAETDLFLYDITVLEWVLADSLCEVETAAPVVVLTDDGFQVTYEICHLTQFAIVKSQADAIEPPSGSGSDGSADGSGSSGSVSGVTGSSEGGASDSNDLSGAAIGGIIAAALVVAILAILAFVVLIRRRRTERAAEAAAGPNPGAPPVPVATFNSSDSSGSSPSSSAIPADIGSGSASSDASGSSDDSSSDSNSESSANDSSSGSSSSS